MKKDKNKKVPDYIQIPYQLIADKTLAPIDRLVYGAVYFYSKMRGEKCFATNTTIAQLLLSTPKTVSRALQNLEDRRYIIRDYSDPDTKKNRTEIIPTIAMGRLSNIKYNVPPNGVSKNKFTDTPNGVTVTPNGVSGSPKWGNPINAIKKGVEEDKSEQIQGEMEPLGVLGVTPNGGESNRCIEKNIEIINVDPDGSGPFLKEPLVELNGKDLERSPGAIVNDAIALFLPIFPGDFIGAKTAFVKIPTRQAVESLLARYSMDEIKELIRKYDEGKSNPYRPETGTVWEFCGPKLAKVEAFVAKSAGNLWAHRSISTPEEAKVRDAQYRAVAERARERSRKAKEEWDKTHPKQ